MDREKLMEIIDSNGRFNLPTVELELLADHLIANGIGDITAENEELKDRCNYIWAIGCDYDGANPNDATQMRQLVDELVGIAVDGLEQTVFCNDEKTEIQPRKVKLCNLKMENARLTEQLENSVQLPKPYIIVTWNGKYEVWQSRIDTFCSVAEDTFDTLPEAEARIEKLKEVTE